MKTNHHAISNSTGWSPKNLRSYLFGLALCLILTLCSFALVKYTLFSKSTIYIGLAVLALTQMIVQAVCFLGLKMKMEGKWNVWPFLFTILIILFVVCGTLWVMYNLTVLMMEPYYIFDR
jgi:cytochrome o ubiquinol oxidase operon protein cyoD